jgi:hypothetical protein
VKGLFIITYLADSIPEGWSLDNDPWFDSSVSSSAEVLQQIHLRRQVIARCTFESKSSENFLTKQYPAADSSVSLPTAIASVMSGGNDQNPPMKHVMVSENLDIIP